MKTLWSKFVVVLVIVAALLFASSTVTYAMGLQQAATPTPAAVGAVDIYFVLAATAFFKNKFNLQDNYAILCAFVMALLIVVGPMVVPTLGTIGDAIVGLVKLFLYAAGSYNLATDVGPKVLSTIVNK